ncbi:MAG TPA: metallophosphoesterase [Polyangia bacterium]
MSRTLGFTILFAVVCTVIAGLHYYFWIRLVRDTQLSGLARHLATRSVVGLAILVVATVSVGRMVPRLGRVLAWPGFIWMGAMFFLLVALLGADIVRLLATLASRWFAATNAFDGSRRVFAARVLASAALASVGGVTAAAIRATRGHIAVKRIEVVLQRLPASLDGTRIVQMCDMHVGGLLGREFVERVVHTANGLAPDIIAVVGDLVDGTVEQLRPALASLTNLRARHGVFFVTGNHEYYSRSGARAWMDELDGMGLRVLRNQRVAIGNGTGGFDLAGVPDHGAARFPEDGPAEDIAGALAGRDPSRAVVLLAHQPVSIHKAASLGVDLQLSGHTHGGQIWPWGALVRLQQPFIRGLHRIGESQLYVSCGTGFWGPPMRLGAPAEITEIVLRSGKTSSG